MRPEKVPVFLRVPDEWRSDPTVRQLEDLLAQALGEQLRDFAGRGERLRLAAEDEARRLVHEWWVTRAA